MKYPSTILYLLSCFIISNLNLTLGTNFSVLFKLFAIENVPFTHILIKKNLEFFRKKSGIQLAYIGL